MRRIKLHSNDARLIFATPALLNIEFHSVYSLSPLKKQILLASTRAAADEYDE